MIPQAHDGQEHDFDLILSVPPGDPFGAADERLDALHAGGCDDATVSSQGEGNLRISFSRQGPLASSVAEAIASVARAVPEGRLEKIEFIRD